jgi:3-phosphoshikimate 1-carboxyvinyltransferase
LQRNSLQGDAQIKDIYSTMGVETSYGEGFIDIKKAESREAIPFFEYDFVACPDLTQTVAVTVAALGWTGLYTGLKTLHIKETDRVAALTNELAKYSVFLSKLPQRFSKTKSEPHYTQEGQAVPTDTAVVETYNDHRMAMSFAPLALIFPIEIADPTVVSKSFPTFWQELRMLGFDIS